MSERNSTASVALVSWSSSPKDNIPPPTIRRIQWSNAPAHNLPNELSPAATSRSITIPGRNEEATRRYRSSSRHGQWVPILQHGQGQQVPVHSHLDSITDYCLPGTHGWEFAKRCRSERGEEQVGKILTGQWPPTPAWEKPMVFRKDIDYRKAEQEIEQGWAVTGWANSIYQDGEIGEWIW